MVEDLTRAAVTTLAAETDILYYFFNQNDTEVGIEITSTNVTALEDTEFSTDLDTIFLIHGWEGNKSSDINTKVGPSLLANHSVNVFVVDWGAFAITNYISAQDSVTSVGEYIAEFIQAVNNTFGLDLSRVALVGHSLGAHVSGNAGAALDGRVGLIVGLDPAGPLFTVLDTSNRLDPTDAVYVHVIHTSILLGYDLTLGDADFYPNGGESQPGCGLDLDNSCSHGRAVDLYAESVLGTTSNFVALQCSTYAGYSLGTCDGNDESVMGGYPVDETASGTYYLDTNSTSPYAEGTV